MDVTSPTSTKNATATMSRLRVIPDEDTCKIISVMIFFIAMFTLAHYQIKGELVS